MSEAPNGEERRGSRTLESASRGQVRTTFELMSACIQLLCSVYHGRDGDSDDVDCWMASWLVMRNAFSDRQKISSCTTRFHGDGDGLAWSRFHRYRHSAFLEF